MAEQEPTWQGIVDERAAQEVARRGVSVPAPKPAALREAEVAADRAIRHLVVTAAAEGVSQEYVAGRLAPWVAEMERVAKIDPEQARANAVRLFEESRAKLRERGVEL